MRNISRSLKGILAAAIMAVTIVRPTVTSAKESFNSLLKAAIEATNQGNWSQAQHCYEQLLDEYPDTPQKPVILSNIAMTQSNQGNNKDALATLDAAVALDSLDTSILETRGRVLYALGNDEAAIRDYSRITRLDPQASYAFFMLGSIYMGMNDTDGALEAFTKLKELQPNAPGTRKAFAAYYTKVKDYPAAIAEYTEIIKNSPEVDAYLGRAGVELMLERLDDASMDIADAMRLDPQDGEVYYLRAALNKERYLLDEARADGKKAVELGVSARRVSNLLGIGPEELK